MSMAVEYQRVRSKKFDFSLASEWEAADPGKETHVRIYLKQNNNVESYLNYDDIVMVMYQLDPTFKSRTISTKDSSNRFEVRIWAHSRFELTATVLLKAGRTEVVTGSIEPLRAS